jgi:hypothetical protein
MSIFVRTMGGLFFVAGIAALIYGIGLLDENEIRLLALKSSVGELKGVLYVMGALMAFFFGTILFLGASSYDHLKRLADINASAAVQISAQSSILSESAYYSTYPPVLPQTDRDEPRPVPAHPSV